MFHKKKPHCSSIVALNASRRLALSTIALLGSTMLTQSANAVDYKYGEVAGSIDTVLSAGASMRTSARDCRNLGQPGGGCKIYDASNIEKGAGVNSDDGNLNYGQWDVFSGALKVTSEASATWRNFNAFVRGTAFVDPIADNTDYRELSSAARSEVSQNAKLLDYFVGGSFEIGGLPLELRGGNQVISWGESTFIQNGLNVINPIDVAATRKPGSEVKEFFAPILAAKAALGLPMNFSIEGFYQFKADNIVPDPSGTYFSSADIVGRGSQPIRSGTSDFGDDDRFNPFQIANGLDSDLYWQSRLAVNVPSVSVERANDKNADDGGEFGFALRYFNEELNNGMEFGLYFINYHSRLPILTQNRTDVTRAVSIGTATTLSGQARDYVGKLNTNGTIQADAATVSGTDLANFNAALAAPNAADIAAGVPAPILAASGPVYSAAAGAAPVNIYEGAQQLCNVLAGPLQVGTQLQAQGVASATGRPFIAGDNARNRSNVDFRIPGGYTNCNNMARLRTVTGTLEASLAAVIANTQNYRLEYPEDIKLVGASMNTTLGSLAFQAEATYRHDQPLSYVGSEVSALFADLDGRTAFNTGADLPAGVGSPTAPSRNVEISPGRFTTTRNQAGNQSAAGGSGAQFVSFAEVTRIEGNQAGIAGSFGALPDSYAASITPTTPGLAQAAALAQQGALTVAALPASLFNPATLVGGAVVPTSTLIGSGGTTFAPPGPNSLIGLGGSTLGTPPAVSAANPAGTTSVVFPAGTAASLVEVANRLGYISLDQENANQAPNVATALAGDVLFARHIDSGTGAVPTPITPQVRSSQLTAANVRPDGYIEIPTEDVFTAQATITSALFGSNPIVSMMKADGGTVVTEVGMVMVPGISTSSAIASASGSEGLLNPIAAATYKLNTDLKGPTNYATPFSWGAQGIFNMTYNRVFSSPVNLVPQIAWKWDFGGRTPSPLGNYMAERKAIGLSLAANYQSRWTGSVSWTANFGPDAPLDDRDFASINIAYAF